MFIFIILLVACGWWFLWKKKYYIRIESAGENADGMVQVLKNQLEMTLTEAQELVKGLPKLVRGGNYLNARGVVKAIIEAGGQAKIEYYSAFQNPLGKEEPEKDENGKTKKKVDSDVKHEMGAVDISAEQAEAVKGQTGDNAKAYAKLGEAIMVGGDNYYPESLEETLKMDALLDESEKAAKNINDPEYYKVLKEMRGIVGWSSRRHFNFSWIIILGSLITIGVVLWIGHGNKEDKKRAKEQVEIVDAWSTKDTLSLEQAMQRATYENRLKSPNLYRAYEINSNENLIASCKKHIEEYKQRMDTISTKEGKENLQKWIKMNEDEIARHIKENKEMKSWDEKDTKKAALERMKKHYKYTARSARRSMVWSFIFLLLIPLYIFANYSWGYVITKTRKESAILAKIQQWTLAIAGGMFGLGSAISLIPDYTGPNRGLSSNDGHAAINAILMTIKLFLMVGAILLIAVVSLVLMIYSIIVGLKRNYDWKAILAKAKAAK